MNSSRKLNAELMPNPDEKNNTNPAHHAGYLLVGLALLFLMALLSGCATAQTDMSLEKDFSGERVMQASLPSWAVQRALGGAAAIEGIIEKNIPAGLTYTSKAEDVNTVYTFVLPFDDPADYRQKVELLLEANPSNTISPLIIMDNGDSPFKQGLSLRENFTSADLLGWLVYHLDEAQILGQKADVEAYCTFADTVVKYAGKEYIVPGNEPLEIDDMERMTFESITSYTRMLWDSSFQRSFAFYIQQDTLAQLKESGVDVQQYLQDILPAHAELTFASGTDNTMVYTITVQAQNEEELVLATNAILQTSNNSFSVQILPANGTNPPQLIVSEYLDGSHYLDYTGYYSSPMVSNLQLFPGCVPTSSSTELPSRLQNADNSVFYAHSIPLHTPVETAFDWNFQFESLEVQFTLGSGISAQLYFKLPYNTSAHIAQIAVQSLSSADFDELTITNNKSKGTDSLVFCLDTGTGSGAEISARLNRFAKNYAQNFTGFSGGELFRISYEKSAQSSFLQPHYTFSGVCDAQVFATRKSTLVQISPAVGYTLGNTRSASSLGESVPLGDGVFAASAEVLGLNWLLIVTPIALVLSIGVLLLRKMLAAHPKKALLVPKKEQDASPSNTQDSSTKDALPK